MFEFVISTSPCSTHLLIITRADNTIKQQIVVWDLTYHDLELLRDQCRDAMLRIEEETEKEISTHEANS